MALPPLITYIDLSMKSLIMLGDPTGAVIVAMMVVAMPMEKSIFYTGSLVLYGKM